MTRGRDLGPPKSTTWVALTDTFFFCFVFSWGRFAPPPCPAVFSPSFLRGEPCVRDAQVVVASERFFGADGFSLDSKYALMLRNCPVGGCVVLMHCASKFSRFGWAWRPI